MRENNERKTFQKYHLSMNTMYSYQIFQNKNTDISIGKSKFAEPKYELYSSDVPQNVCTCINYQNVMLILQALHRIDSIYPLYNLDLPNKLICFQPNDDCWFNKCNQCKDPLMFSKYYPLENDSTLQEIRWCQ